jgi:hypothetical protein
LFVRAYLTPNNRRYCFINDQARASLGRLQVIATVPPLGRKQREGVSLLFAT